MAVSAVDNALWDLKSKIFDVPLCTLLGKVNDAYADLWQRWIYFLQRCTNSSNNLRIGHHKALHILK